MRLIKELIPLPIQLLFILGLIFTIYKFFISNEKSEKQNAILKYIFYLLYFLLVQYFISPFIHINNLFSLLFIGFTIAICTYELYKIRKLWKLGLKPIEIIVKSNLLNEEALSLEIELIAAIGRKDKSLGPLLNLTDGGDGTINLSFSKKTSEKLSQSLKMAHAAGKFRGAQKLLIGRKRDDNTKNKIKNALLGKKFDQQRKTNIKNSMNSYYSKIENVKKYLVLNDKQEPILTILSNNAISELGFSGLYNSFRKNRPMQRGPFKGWQLIAL